MKPEIGRTPVARFINVPFWEKFPSESGQGLWPSTDVEFRGAAFPIGGDATIDGLVTIPNILNQFNAHVDGVSHGMGDRDKLPDYQFNVAQSGTETEDLPAQAMELIRRLRLHIGKGLRYEWTLVTIATGTEEFCDRCEGPNHSSLRRALGALRKGIPKALVILLGPVHVASSYKQNINLLKPRCSCLERLSRAEYKALVYEWRDIFLKVEREFNSFNYTTFGVLTIPALTIHSRDPQSLFVHKKPLLNRKGHTYAAKWLWNRLMTGPNYNISQIVFSQDSYYCPSAGCPYFRTVQNFGKCVVVTEDHWQAENHPSSINSTAVPHREQVRKHLLGVILLILGLAIVSVSIFGTIFFCHGMRSTVGRFDFGKNEDGTDQTYDPEEGAYANSVTTEDK